MTVITFDFPTAADEELIRRFTVSKNYVQAIAGDLKRQEHLMTCLIDRPSLVSSITSMSASSQRS